MWRKIRVTVCHRLHQRRAILANRDIQRDIFPPIYHGLWQKWWHNVMSEADPSHLKLLPASILDIYKVFDHIDIDMLSIGIWKQPYSVILPTLLGSDFGVLGHLSKQMMSLRHIWGWQPPQTASRIHIRHIQSVWAHWYAVHTRMVAALPSYSTHPTWLRFWCSGSLVHPKRCHYVIS
jgi:hypothetical protein